MKIIGAMIVLSYILFSVAIAVMVYSFKKHDEQQKLDKMYSEYVFSKLDNACARGMLDYKIEGRTITVTCK